MCWLLLPLLLTVKGEVLPWYQSHMVPEVCVHYPRGRDCGTPGAGFHHRGLILGFKSKDLIQFLLLPSAGCSLLRAGRGSTQAILLAFFNMSFPLTF